MRLAHAFMIVSCATGALMQLLGDAEAKVARVETISTAPYGNFGSGEYIRRDLRIFGELSPTSEPIPDLDKATRNSRGMVEYATRLTLIMPADPTRGNGALLLDVPNRGRAISLSLYNSPRTTNVLLGSFNQGTGFLQDAGF